MRVTLAAVISLDGRATRGDDPNNHAWSSTEDWHHFMELRDLSDAVIIDRLTYETVKPEPEAARLRVVLTNHPGLYAGKEVPNQLEFTGGKPTTLLKNLQQRGKQRVLVAGNNALLHSFLAAGVVDDLYLSFEPVLFGSGEPLIEAPQTLNVQLQLQSVKELNKQGTLLAHYIVANTGTNTSQPSA
ncbi:MAG TPA: dihydrofolate reductase family protein [Patescibacteria group bacterium]|nr:dihydrofolate reductase family protein [Patescibacteria group bacterium]